MELSELDFRKLFNTMPNTELEEEHVITILYNQLCALNFIHSANIIHRDLKPANFLIDSECNVKICDFGLARILPKPSDIEKKISKHRKHALKVIKNQEEEKENQSQQVIEAVEGG